MGLATDQAPRLLIDRKVGTAKVLRLTLLDNQRSDIKTFYDIDGRSYRN